MSHDRDIVSCRDCCGVTIKGQRCHSKPGSVAANGFCARHQHQINPYIFKQIEHLTHEIQTLETLSGASLDGKKVDQLIQRMKLLELLMKKGENVCDEACEHALKEVILGIREINENPPNIKHMMGYGQKSPIDRMKDIERTLTQQSLASQGSDVDARKISIDWEAAQRQKEDNQQALRETTQKMEKVYASARAQENEFQMSLQKLTRDLEHARLGKQAAENQLSQVKEAIDTCQAQSSQISGVHAQTIQVLKQEMLKYKGLYENMVGREIKLSQSIKQLTSNEQLLKKTMEEIQAKHQEEVKKLKAAADTVGVPQSRREAELEEEIESLKSSLQEATKELQMAHDAGREVLERVSTLEQPSGDLAKQMIQINTELHRQSQQSAKLEAELAEARDALAHKELACATSQQQINANLRQEIVTLNNQVYNLQTAIRDRQNIIAKLQQEMQAMKMNSEGRVGQIQQRLSMAQAALNQMRNQVEQEKAQVENQRRAAQVNLKARENELDLKFSQMKESLNARFMERSRMMQQKYEYTQNQLEEERRNLAGVRSQIQQTAQIMQQKENQMQAMSAAFEQKQAEFLQQKDQLASALEQAKSQASQFSELERNHQNRVNMLRQKIAGDRQRYDVQVSSMQKYINQLKEERVQIVNNLERCGAARDALVAKNNYLLDENTRLKDAMAQSKANLDMMRTQYQATMAKMRSDAARLQRDVRACSAKMQDVSMVHDHMMRAKKESEQLRMKLREQIAASKANEQAFQRLLRDRELNKQEVARLQQALHACGDGKKTMGRQLIDLNKQLYEMKNIDSGLKEKLQDLSEDYQRAMLSSEADMHRQVMEQKMHEQQYRNQLTDLQSQNMQLSQQLGHTEQESDVLRNAVSDIEVQSAQQIGALMQAQQMRPGRAQLTGQSSLVRGQPNM